MSGIENLADRKRSVEIGFVRASRGQAADEHGARIAGIEIVSGGGRYGDNVGGARGAGNSDGSGGWIGQVHSRKQACSSRSHINQTRAGLKRDLRICSSIQRNVVDGAVGRRPNDVRGAREALELRRHIRVVVQVDDESDVCGSKRHNGSMRKWIDADGVGERLHGCLAGRVGLRNHAAQIHGCNRRARGNRENGKRLTRVIHDRGNVGLRWSQ